MDKPRIMDSLLSSMKLKNIFGLGRWGEWEHLNFRCCSKTCTEFSPNNKKWMNIIKNGVIKR